MRTLLGAIVFLVLGFLAFLTSYNKRHDYHSLQALRVGLSVNELSFLGEPFKVTAEERTYIMPDFSKLTVKIQDSKVAQAWLDLKEPLILSDVPFGQHRFVQMGLDSASRPTWFYAGSPEFGRILKVSENGHIQSISWVNPFEDEQPRKNIQALLRDFSTQVQKIY